MEESFCDYIPYPNMNQFVWRIAQTQLLLVSWREVVILGVLLLVFYGVSEKDLTKSFER